MTNAAHEPIQVGAMTIRFHVDARVLAVISPGLMGSAYFKDVAEVPAGAGLPNIEEIGEVIRRHGLTPAPPA